MKTSEKYYQKMIDAKWNLTTITMESIKTYGEMCRLEEALKHAKWTSYKKQERIKKQLKEYEKEL